MRKLTDTNMRRAANDEHVAQMRGASEEETFRAQRMTMLTQFITQRLAGRPAKPKLTLVATVEVK